MYQRQRTYQVWPPLAWAGSAFVLGALFSPELSGSALWAVLISLVVVWIALIFTRTTLRLFELLRYVLAVLSFVALGWAYRSLDLTRAEAVNKSTAAAGRYTAATLVISSDTVTTYGSLRAEALVLASAGGVELLHQKVRVRLPKGSYLAWGDTVLVSLKYWPSAQKTVPWAQYAPPSQYQYQVSLLAVHQVRKQQAWHIKGLMLGARQWLEQNLRNAWNTYTFGQQNKALTQVQALLHGLSLGLRQGIAPEINDQFSNSGTAHILSVSGMHMMVLFALLQGLVTLVNPAPKLKRVIWYAVSVLLWAYALLTGMSAAAIRAAAMASVLVLAEAHHKSHAMLNALGLAAIVMVVLEPLVVHSISFQLSFLGCVGIALWGQWPTAQRWLMVQSWPRWVSALLQTAMVSIGAMLATLPITAYHFGQVPMLFLPANILAGITSSALTLVSLAMALLGQIPILNWALVALAHVLGALTLFIVELMGRVDQTIQLPFLGMASMVLYLIMAILLWQALKMQQTWALLLSCLVLAVTPLVVLCYPHFWYAAAPQGLYAWKNGRSQHVAYMSSDTVYWLSKPPQFRPKVYNRWLSGRPQKLWIVSDSAKGKWLQPFVLHNGHTFWIVTRKPLHHELVQSQSQLGKNKADVVVALERGAYQANMLLEAPVWLVPYPKSYLPQDVQMPLVQGWYHIAQPSGAHAP